MPANDSTSNPLFAGIQSAGNSLGEGVKQAILNYRDRQQREAALTGQLEAMISSHGAAGIQALSPDGQKLAQKFISGDASYKDKLQLMGEGQTALALQDDAQKKAAAQQALTQGQQAISDTAQKYAMGQISLEQAQRQNEFIKRMIGQGQQAQPQGMPQGSGPLANPNATPQAPVPAAAMSPGLSGAINRYAGMTGSLPPASMMTDMMKQAGEQAAQSKTPIGLVPDGVEYKDGLPVANTFKQAYKVGAGTPAEQTMVDDASKISVAPGQLPPGNAPILNRGTFAPLTPPELAAIQTAPPSNPNDPEWQKDLMTANVSSAQSAAALGKAQLLQQAIGAYNADPATGGRLNALLGTDKGSSIRQFFTGTNPRAGLQMALSNNVAGMLASLKGPNGSLGTRVTGTEWQQTMDSLGKSDMPPDQLAAAGDNAVALAQRQMNIDQAYATYRKTMPAGDASALAVKQFGTVPVLQSSRPSGANPANAILLKYGLPVSP